MSEWRLRRFWTRAEIAPVGEGPAHSVLLDGRPVRTPGKAALALPTRALAEAVAAEWDAQGEFLRPETMPFTRTANTAIDRLGPAVEAVVADLAGYGGSDLLCYRATQPAELAARQAVEWEPLLAWAEERFGAPLVRTEGVMPVAQPAESLERLAERIAALDLFRLAAFHDLVVLSGSLVLALAVLEGRIAPEEGWRLSRLDEDWQAEQWGEDEEAAQQAAARRSAFLEAAAFLALLG